jgi:hypothetical protein
MKHLVKVLISFCLFGYGTTIQAQNSIPAAGGNATGSGGSVSYTIGQVVYTTVSGSNGSMNQGVQLPFEISVITAISGTSGITLSLSVYPNPANGFVTLRVEGYDAKNLSYMLFDINGVLFQNSPVLGDETRIQLGNIIPGTYILKVVENKKELKTFKIIKN